MLRSTSVLALLLLALLPAAPVRAGAILNTLQGYDRDEVGWSGALDALFSGSGGNTESVQATAGGRVQHREGPDRWRLQISGEYEESGRAVTARSAVAHLRHNHDLGPGWATVAFGQLQTNPFQRLTSRWLLGAGLRRDLVEDDRGVLSVGVTPMLEIERLRGQDGRSANGRTSAFLHAGRPLGADSRLDAFVFWQPRLVDMGDVRTVANVTVTVALHAQVDLKLGVAVQDDSRPPAGVERTDWDTFAGLGWVF